MEVDSSGDQEWEALEAAQAAQGVASDGLESGVGSIMKDLMTSVPGIDEAMAFAELMKMVQEMNYSTIVFDTAPTGHTLRLLSFPKTMESAIGKLLELKVRKSSFSTNELLVPYCSDENNLVTCRSAEIQKRVAQCNLNLTRNTFVYATEPLRWPSHTGDCLYGSWRR